MLRPLAVIATLMFCPIISPSLAAQTMETSQGVLKVEKMADGFDVPWGFTFLPDGALLVTERAGRLWYLKGGRRHAVKGVPEVAADGQGGLLDVVAARNFAKTRLVYLTFSRQQGRGAGTAVARAQLSEDGTRFDAIEVIFEATAGARGGRHFGARLVEASDGSLFVSLGERGDRSSAQDLSREQGSIIRISPDGGIPDDNPFLAVDGARAEIWSFGHRNPQGMALDSKGQLWAVEHGARGGDEINRIERGANYGWPVISYGRHYSGLKIGEGSEKPGMQQPEWYWDPSIAPSGMMIYSGKLWPNWRGDIFVGSLKFDYISRLSGERLREVETLKSPATGRLRDIREAPDGAIWFASEHEGALYRIIPR